MPGIGRKNREMFDKVMAMAVLLLLAIILASPTKVALAQENGKGPTKVRTGVYITNVYDIDLTRKSFNINYWAWFVHDKPDYKPIESVEIVNAKSSTSRYASTTKTKDVLWDQAKYFALVAQDWDIAHFPYDRHVLKLYLEDALSAADAIQLVADTENSRIDKNVTIPGWTIEGFSIADETSVYDTTYGDPTLSGQSAYSRVVVGITVKRQGLRILASLFLGFFVAFGLTSLTYFLDLETMTMSRFSLCASAIFASVGNKYVVDVMLPPATSITLADVIEATTFIAILISLAAMVVMHVLMGKNPRFARIVNRIVGGLTITLYLAANGLMIAQSIA